MTALLNVFVSLFHIHNLGWPRKGPRKYGKRTYYQQCVVCGENVPYRGPLF